MNTKIAKNQMPFFDHCFDKNRLKKWITKIYYETIFTEDLTILNFVETLKTLGFKEATRAGVSIGIDDLSIPPAKTTLLQTIENEVEQANRQFDTGRLTALENFQNFIDTWHRASETIKMEVVANFEETDTLNPVYMMAFSGARGNLSQVSQLVGMRGFMSDPEGQIINYPIRSNFREGLTLTEYVISCYGARKGLVDTALRTADAGYLTRRLVDVAHSVVIVEYDCKTKQGVWLTAIKQNSKVLYPLEKRLVGRVLAEGVYFPYTDTKTNKKQALLWPYFNKNQQIDSVRAKLLSTCFTRVLIRSSLRCLKKKRLCQLCYGWTLPHAHLAPIGEAVGILAAQSIGEPGTQLTMRTFHTGGVFSGALSDQLKAPYSGQIQYDRSLNGALFRTSNGQLAFRTTEAGKLTIYPLKDQLNLQGSSDIFELDFPATSILFLKNFETVLKGSLLIELPKEEESDKETVLNTYVYYSKQAGLLEACTVTPIDIYRLPPGKDAGDQYEFFTHKKLPKVDPYFELALCHNTEFYKLKIHAGQIEKTTSANQILPQPGDLIDTQSIMSLTHLLYPNSTQLYIPQKAEQLSTGSATAISKLPQLMVQKTILNLSLSKLQYNKRFGYFSKYTKLGIRLILPCLKPSARRFHDGFGIYFKEIRPLTGGKTFCPFVYSKLTDLYVNNENKMYDEQVQNLVNNPISKRNLNKKFNSKPKYQVSVQSYFEVSEPIYYTFKSQVKRKPKTAKRFRKKFKNHGSLLSNYKTTILDNRNNLTSFASSKKFNANSRGSYLNLSKTKVQWIQNKHVLCQQFNLQKQCRIALANKDGFLKPKIQNEAQKLSWSYKGKRALPKLYWKTDTKYQLKTGWPYLQFQNKIGISNHKKFQLFGQNIVSGISFPSKCVYTEYITQPSFNWYAITKIQKSRVFLMKTNQLKAIRSSDDTGQNNLFTSVDKIPCILLIRPTNELAFIQTNTSKQTRIYQNVFYKDQIFEDLKQVQNLPLKQKFKLAFIKRFFQELNKQLSTSDNSTSLIQQSSSLHIRMFSRNIFALSSNTFINSSQTNFYEEVYRRSVNFIQFALKLSPNRHLNTVTTNLALRDTFTLNYKYSLACSLESQNFFKNNSCHQDTLYTLTPKLKSNYSQLKTPGGLPIVESHYLSKYKGELLLSRTEKNTRSLILTAKDTCTIKSDFVSRKCQIGDEIHCGFEVTQGQTTPQTGKVIHITKTHVRIQFVENSMAGPNARFFCEHNQLINKTTQLFTQSYPRLQMGDIVQGIPKIEEFFEARRTKNGKRFKNNLNRRVNKRYFFYKKKCRYMPYIATKKSIHETQEYIIASIFKLYSSQGIDLSDKHLEIIVRQMTCKVKITQFWTGVWVPFKHPLPTELYSRQHAERYQYRKRNTFGCNLRFMPFVMGITRAALENDSVISAASFQETTRILSRGAVFQKKDYLKGLKENVILGHIIPAGTAVRTYSRRFKPPVMQHLLSQQALQVLTINHQWKLGLVDSIQPSSQYFNPIRHTIIKLICLEYIHTVL